MDVVLINKVRQAIGFAWCDEKQLIFVSENNFGMGIRSVSVEILKSICRELEIQLIDRTYRQDTPRASRSLQSRQFLQYAGQSSIATYDDINQGIRNFIMEAIRHIAHYGFYLRDMTELHTTYLIESAIILAQNGLLLKKFRHLQDIKAKTIQMLQDYIHALYTAFEWSDNKLRHFHTSSVPSDALLLEYQRSINHTSNWQKLSALSCLMRSGTEDIVTEAENFTFMDGLLNLNRNELLTKIESQYIQPNRLSVLAIESLITGGWPLIIATDGGVDKFDSNRSHSQQSSTSASVVIFHPPAISFAQYTSATEAEQASILNQNLLPWRARAASLPLKIGNQLTDNAYAECFAIILMEEWLPPNLPVLHIMDSEAERERYNHLRTMQRTTNRFMIRSLLAGVSKCLGSRLAFAISKHQSIFDIPQSFFESNIIEFCIHAKRWCYSSSGDSSLWHLRQWAPAQL